MISTLVFAGKDNNPKNIQPIVAQEMLLVSGNSLMPSWKPLYGLSEPLGAMIDTKEYQSMSLREIGVNMELLERIIFCESGYDTLAKNPNSTARGLFQIVRSSELFCEKGLGRELNMFDSEDNISCAFYLLQHGGLSHWEESKYCWE
jgi:hypothetical protein